MFGFKSMVAKFAFWSVLLLLLVVATFWKRCTCGTTSAPAPTISTTGRTSTSRRRRNLRPTPTVRDAALNTNIEVKQVTVLQFPLLKADGTQQQRVDRCQSCHAGLLDPNMTAEKLIKVLDNQTVPTEQVAAYLSDPKHEATLEAVKTLGAHPGIRVETKDNPHDLGIIHGAEIHLWHHDRSQFERRRTRPIIKRRRST